MLSDKPVVSIFGSSARPQLWSRILKNLSEESLPFEIVYTGPKIKIPDDPIPVIFQESYYKPVQCSQISATRTKGDFILLLVDDLVFVEKTPLTSLVDQYYKLKAIQDNEIILSTKLQRLGVPFADNNYYLNPEDTNTAIPISIFLQRSLFNKLGGFDNRFITSMADSDLVFRAQANSGIKFYYSDVFVEESNNSAGEETLFSIYGSRDLSLLKKFWITNSRLDFTKRPPEKFFTKKVAIRREGPNGIWIFNSQSTINFLKKYLLSFNRYKKNLYYYLAILFKKIKQLF